MADRLSRGMIKQRERERELERRMVIHHSLRGAEILTRSPAQDERRHCAFRLPRGKKNDFNSFRNYIATEFLTQNIQLVPDW